MVLFDVVLIRLLDLKASVSLGTSWYITVENMNGYNGNLWQLSNIAPLRKNFG
mgnify:CR=1 FL=1